MKTSLIKLTFIYLFILINHASAQNKHNNKDGPMKMLFSIQNSEYSAEVLSVSEKLVTKRNIEFVLKLSSTLLIDSSSVALRINSDSGTEQTINKLMEYSSGLYNSIVQFQEPGSHQFTFSFDLKDSSGNLKKAKFSFTKNVEDADNMNNHEHGFMGMSNVMMIVMGAAMVSMMVIAIIVGTNHK